MSKTIMTIEIEKDEIKTRRPFAKAGKAFGKKGYSRRKKHKKMEEIKRDDESS